MVLPTSGPLSLNDIQGEFGGTNPISLSEYYAGGAFVPAGTSGTNGPVPSSGTISISNFYGTSNVVISVTGQFISAFNFGAGATAAYRLNSNGQVEQVLNGGASTLEQWCTPTSAAGNYEARVTITADTLDFGDAVNTWLALSTTRTWGVGPTLVPGTRNCTFTVEIRRIGTSTVLSSASIDLYAEAI
jgi:hypothetical protein